MSIREVAWWYKYKTFGPLGTSKWEVDGGIIIKGQLDGSLREY